jgi:protein gp37
MTAIPWCHHTFNGWIGCYKISPGCANCYASVDTFTRVQRSKGNELWGKNAARHITSDANWRKPLRWDNDAADTGERRRVFASSLCDVFEDRDDLHAPRLCLWKLILNTPNLDWLLLTKRPENVLPSLRKVHDLSRKNGLIDDCLGAWIDGSYPPDNVWLGVSVENQAEADRRIPILLSIPARVRFLSVEPLLGPVDLEPYLAPAWVAEPDPDGAGYDVPGIDWLIVGGESGPKARPFDLAWARSLQEQCAAAGVAYFMKQVGANACEEGHRLSLRDSHGGNLDELPADLRVRQFPDVRRETP